MSHQWQSKSSDGSNCRIWSHYSVLSSLAPFTATGVKDNSRNTKTPLNITGIHFFNYLTNCVLQQSGRVPKFSLPPVEQPVPLLGSFTSYFRHGVIQCRLCSKYSRVIGMGLAEKLQFWLGFGFQGLESRELEKNSRIKEEMP